VLRPEAAAQGATQSPVARILTETDVYLKYGLQQKALDHVEKLLETDPENPDALERIRDIREALGDRPGAAQAAGRAVKALRERGEDGRIGHATERLRQLDPGHALAEELRLPDDEPPKEHVLAVPPDEDALKTVTGPEGPAPVQDDESPVAIDADPGMPAVLGDDSPLPVDDSPLPVGDDAPRPDGPPLEVDIEEVEPEAVEDAGPRTPPPLVLVPPPPPQERSWEPLDAEMEEVGFYERQGLLEEALLAIRELAAAHPGHPDVEPALARIEQLAALEGGGADTPVGEEPTSSEPDAAQAPSEAGGDREAYGSTGTTGIFDLGAELSAELGPELTPTPTGEFQYSVADVFDQFKRGLEKTVRPDDSATKYDLGIAFQEMGMLDEALEQFRSALAGGDRRREVEILNMIGVCLGLKGRHREAIGAYLQALASEFVTEEAAKALHFELGAAHEALGEPDLALGYFQKVAQGDPGYRGVVERVSRLGGGPGSGPDPGARQAPTGKKARKR
jgi:tetratricopeptide (TPR) repeat protein